MKVCEVCNSPNLYHDRCIDCGHEQSQMMHETEAWPESLQTKGN